MKKSTFEQFEEQVIEGDLALNLIRKVHEDNQSDEFQVMKSTDWNDDDEDDCNSKNDNGIVHQHISQFDACYLPGGYVSRGNEDATNELDQSSSSIHYKEFFDDDLSSVTPVREGNINSSFLRHAVDPEEGNRVIRANHRSLLSGNMDVVSVNSTKKTKLPSLLSSSQSSPSLKTPLKGTGSQQPLTRTKKVLRYLRQTPGKIKNILFGEKESTVSPLTTNNEEDHDDLYLHPNEMLKRQEQSAKLVGGLFSEILRMDEERQEEQQEIATIMNILQNELEEKDGLAEAHLKESQELKDRLNQIPRLSVENDIDRKQLQRHLGSIIKIFNDKKIDLEFIAGNNERVHLVETQV